MDTEGAHEKYLEIKDQLKNLDGSYLVCILIVSKILMWNKLFSDVISSYPEEIQSSKAIKFDKIVQISAKNEPDDIKRVKLLVREVLDVNDELSNEIEYKSLQNLKEQIREHGPVLVWVMLK